MKKTLVTGAAGLIGSMVCQKLLERNMAVVAADNFSIGDWHSEHHLLTWLKLDLTDSNLESHLNGHDITAVIHCAAHPGGKSLEEPVLDVEVNSLGSMRLFYWCAKNKIDVIYLSSSAVYGPGHPDKPLIETDQTNPGTIYAVCKVACEQYLKILGEGHNLKWTVLRLFATYGNGHKANTYQGIVNVMLTQLLSTNNTIVVKGSLERVRGLIYVEDAAEAIVNTLLAPQARGHILNISHPKPLSIKSILDQLISITKINGKQIKVEAGTVGDPLFNYANSNLATELINFNPKYSFKEGAEKLIKQRIQNKG